MSRAMSAIGTKRTLQGKTAAYPGFDTGFIWKSVEGYLPA